MVDKPADRFQQRDRLGIGLVVRGGNDPIDVPAVDLDSPLRLTGFKAPSEFQPDLWLAAARNRLSPGRLQVVLRQIDLHKDAESWVPPGAVLRRVPQRRS